MVCEHSIDFTSRAISVAVGGQQQHQQRQRCTFSRYWWWWPAVLLSIAFHFCIYAVADFRFPNESAGDVFSSVAKRFVRRVSEKCDSYFLKAKKKVISIKK
uniref:Uncharacterized protein n=1 Tax=Bactrocera latifrons TaxID=174628 RepID=A0A0K8V251_BACLA